MLQSYRPLPAMKHLIDLETWPRREHFVFFSAFEEPFFGLTAHVDCTAAQGAAKRLGVSFFLYYLYQALEAANWAQATVRRSRGASRSTRARDGAASGKRLRRRTKKMRSARAISRSRAFWDNGSVSGSALVWNLRLAPMAR